MSKTRSPNFTTPEVILLLELVDKYKHVVENKKTDGASVAQKTQTWKRISEEFLLNGYTRTADSLMACYRTQKKKIKKEVSIKKMQIPIPEQTKIISAVDDYGQDWETISLTLGDTPKVCEEKFGEIVIDMKKQDVSIKKDLMKTGGGTNGKQPLAVYDKLKALIGTQCMEGIYTSYDSDAEFLKEQQQLKDDEEKQLPIECNHTIVSGTSKRKSTSAYDAEEADEEADPGQWANILKKKKDDSLCLRPKAIQEPFKSDRRHPTKKRTVSDSFLMLSDSKRELVDLNIEAAKIELEEKRKQSQHNDLIRQLELEIKKTELSILKEKLCKLTEK